MKHKEYEKRACTHEVRMTEDGADKYIEGYAAKFDTKSEDFGGWYETIAPGAFDDVLGDDVRALVDHIPSKILGRTKSGTLTLSVDNIGLKYRALIPNTTYGNDLSVSLSRGDIDQSSFGFRILDAAWEMRDGKDVRVIKKIKRLYDVSPVTFPAYEDTSVSKRSFDAHKLEENNIVEQEKIQAEHVMMTLKLNNIIIKTSKNGNEN